jgi:hypothetical protein
VDTSDASEQAEDHPQLAPPPAELAVSQAQFPCFRIWREETCDRARYVSRSLHYRLNPHTVITDDLWELRAALEPARHLPCPNPHPPGQHPRPAAPEPVPLTATTP